MKDYRDRDTYIICSNFINIVGAALIQKFPGRHVDLNCVLYKSKSGLDTPSWHQKVAARDYPIHAYLRNGLHTCLGTSVRPPI